MLEEWQIADFDVGEGLAAGAQHGAGEGWIAARAPGDTYLALVGAGRITHPFEGRAEHDAAWVKDREWWWRSRFEAAPVEPGERVELVFEGLDTFATVYLNGVLLGETDNMFREWRFDVTRHLAVSGPNVLAIAFAPTARMVEGREMPLWSIIGDPITETKRNFIRKAQFGWGWDWGPRLPTIGVWQPVRLERRETAMISDLRFTTLSLSVDRAEVRVDLAVERLSGGHPLQAEVVLTGPEGREVARILVPVDAAASLPMTISEPRLWWTADLGAQPLYTLAVRLFDGHETLDERTLQIGIRTIELDTSDDPDEPGTSFFRFVLNGVPIFARGACWIPASSFVGAVDEDRVRDLLATAVQANMNMLRVWGGGVYESDAFFDLCDRLGILVWQDFMFACAPYPEDDPAFVENVRHEVRHQIRRLRHHASLALWCGSNETEAVQGFVNLMTGADDPLLGALYYNKIMPEALAELDPRTPYWSSSPSGGPSGNSMRAGDVHHWTVWHGLPLVPDALPMGAIDDSPAGVAYQRYAEDMARFVSEFGIISSPSMETLRRWLAPEDLALGSDGLLDRIKDKPKDKIDAILLPVTGLPRTIEDYVDFSQLAQAEGMKFGIEHFRRRKPHCSGTLIWQYNDCWPGMSWSLVDYDGVGKASLAYVARAYAPVLASFKALDDDAFELWITSDRLQPISGEAIVEVVDLAGAVVRSETIAFTVPANASVAIWQGVVGAHPDQLLAVRSVEGTFAPNRALLVPVKDMSLVAGATPAMAIDHVTDHELRITLHAEAYLLFVHVVSDRPDLRFEDNFFDMRAGETRTITVRGLTAVLKPEDVTVRCWNTRC